MSSLAKRPVATSRISVAEQGQHRQRAEGVVALALPAPLQVIPDGAGPAYELGEACIGRAGESPDQAKNQQAYHRNADPAMPYHGVAADIHRDEGGNHAKHQQPSERSGSAGPRGGSAASDDGFLLFDLDLDELLARYAHPHDQRAGDQDRRVDAETGCRWSAPAQNSAAPDRRRSASTSPSSGSAMGDDGA
jgi:hypothetical protein